VIEENEEVVVPEIDLETQDESDSKGDEVRLGVDMPSPSTQLAGGQDGLLKHYRMLESM
jgi:hypothetical protein